jgi:hypothetical protein
LNAVMKSMSMHRRRISGRFVVILDCGVGCLGIWGKKVILGWDVVN